MILTDKCKEEFELWFRQKKANSKFRFWMLIEIEESVLNALIIEFFDSFGIYISVEVYGSPEFKIKYESIVSIKSEDWYLQGQFSEIYLTRSEATQSAILKANEIFNNLNK